CHSNSSAPKAREDRLAASELPDSKTKKWRVISIIVGGLIALACGVTACICFLRKRAMKEVLPSTADGRLAIFKYNELQLTTKGFSEKLGSGSFGSVFKGVLPDKTVVAVKKLEGLRQGEKQFRAEMSTIGTIHHINLDEESSRPSMGEIVQILEGFVDVRILPVPRYLTN
ncbi:hypothetical protein E2562_001110, partial [Oryza meyeriana var. granulata]